MILRILSYNELQNYHECKDEESERTYCVDVMVSSSWKNDETNESVIGKKIEIINDEDLDPYLYIAQRFIEVSE